MPSERSPDLDDATREVAGALRAFERDLDAFLQALAHGNSLVSLDPRFASTRPVETVCDAFGTIDYAMEDEVQSSVSCVGVVCASAATIARAQQLNASKQNLQAVCAPLQKRRMRIRVRNAAGEEVVRMTTLVRVILRNIGRSHLNLTAAYRQVPILGAYPARIAYTRTLTRRVRRMTREALLERLQFSDKPRAAEDRQRLRSTPDVHLALVDPHVPNVRANVWYQSRDSRNRDCVQLSAELPILYRAGRRPALPEISFPDAADWAREADGPRRPRATKLEPEPLLATLPVYRYRPPPRRR
jgi:hypothetical protein